MSYVTKYRELDVHFETHNPDDWQPTAHGEFLATYLAEQSFCANKHVLELGAGTGIHTLFLCRQQPTSLTVTEYRQDLLETTKRNVHELHSYCSLHFVVADWLQLEGTFDVVVTNPPFSRCPVPGDRRHFIDRLINNSKQRLKAGGHLVFVQSSMANIGLTKSMLEDNGFTVEIPQSITGPFRQDYYDNPSFMEEVRNYPDGYSLENGQEFETLYIVHARL